MSKKPFIFSVLYLKKKVREKSRECLEGVAYKIMHGNISNGKHTWEINVGIENTFDTYNAKQQYFVIPNYINSGKISSDYSQYLVSVERW